jgi:hypothetical protein
MEGIHRKIADDALKGEIKSAAFLFNRYAALVSGELQPQDMSEDDRAVLEAFAQQASGAVVVASFSRCLMIRELAES